MPRNNLNNLECNHLFLRLNFENDSDNFDWYLLKWLKKTRKILIFPYIFILLKYALYFTITIFEKNSDFPLTLSGYLLLTERMLKSKLVSSLQSWKGSWKHIHLILFNNGCVKQKTSIIALRRQQIQN